MNKIDPKDEQDLKKLSDRIKQLRKKKGFSNADFFAYENGFSRAQYARYEAGSNITFLTLVRIVRAHGITIEEFFAEGF